MRTTKTQKEWEKRWPAIFALAFTALVIGGLLFFIFSGINEAEKNNPSSIKPKAKNIIKKNADIKLTNLTYTQNSGTVRIDENGNIKVKAKLPNLSSDFIYSIWLTKSNNLTIQQTNPNQVKLGNLKLNATEWSGTFKRSDNSQNFAGVFVTLELIDDNKPEKGMLFGRIN